MKKFVIIARQRSGSTYLYRLLDNHPAICCRDEIFRRGARNKGNFTYYYETNVKRKIIYKIFGNKYLIKRLPYNIIISKLIKNFLNEMQKEIINPYMHKAFGFKLMYNQFNSNYFFKTWIPAEKIYLIHLIRNNALKIHLSWLTRLKRNIAHSEYDVKPVKVFVDPKTIVGILDTIVRTQNYMKNRLIAEFQNNPYLEITYEDILNNFTEPLEKTFLFLNLEKYQISKPTLKKLNPDSVESIIKNYHEISQILKETPYEHFLK